MTNEHQTWITLTDLWQLPSDINEGEALMLWIKFRSNEIGWGGYTSEFLYTNEKVTDLAERFINSFSTLLIADRSIKTQLPIKYLWYADNREDESRYIRGMLWSNGILWEEIIYGYPRKLFLLLDQETLSMFSTLETPNLLPDKSVSESAILWDVIDQKRKKETK